MRNKYLPTVVLITGLIAWSCSSNEKKSDMNIVFLHHSTGGVIWEGDGTHNSSGIAGKIKSIFTGKKPVNGHLPALFEKYYTDKGKYYNIEDMIFPKASPYGWNNYAYDYYNIWVKNGGAGTYKEEPTLETLTKKYQVVMFKHCFPSSNILADKDSANIDSDIKTLGNYKAQYEAIKSKLTQFPGTKFIIWTGAVQVMANMTEDEAMRAREFNTWVKEVWDQPDDNIFLWDFYQLQTEGGLYFKDEFAASTSDSHPNKEFAGRVVKLLFNRIIDVIEGSGSATTLTGEPKN